MEDAIHVPHREAEVEMATQQEQQMQNMQGQITILLQELNALRQENVVLQQRMEATAVAATSSQQTLQLVGEQTRQMQELVQDMKSLKKTSQETTLVDAKGLGKPWTFQNDQDKFISWSRKTENYVVGIFGE